MVREIETRREVKTSNDNFHERPELGAVQVNQNVSDPP